MSRPLAAAAAGLALATGAATVAAARSADVPRPNPALVELALDYVEPIPGADGRPATLAPLRREVIPQALADRAFLGFQRVDDLGGFAPAPVGGHAITGSGRNVVGQARTDAELPQYDEAAGGRVRSYAFSGAGAFTPPEQGTEPVPGLGVPTPVTPPSNSNELPPPNQGFAGAPPREETPGSPGAGTTSPPGGTTAPPGTTTPPAPSPGGTTAPEPESPAVPTRPGTTTTPAPPPPPTTGTTTPGEPPATAPAEPEPPPSGVSCGTAGVSITSDHASCRLVALNMAPGGSVSEVMTIRNDSGEPFTLLLRAEGMPNALWNELRLGVWRAGTAAPTPLPALLWWTGRDAPLATLEPGESIRLRVELSLPGTAGNEVQNLTAVIDFVWTARG